MRALNQPGSPNASVLPSMGWGGLAPHTARKELCGWRAVSVLGASLDQVWLFMFTYH